MSEELVTFFKALADSSRLKIVGLLAEKPYSVEELAELLSLKASTVSHHLSRLAEVGLVRSRSEADLGQRRAAREAVLRGCARSGDRSRRVAGDRGR